jgi:hypothetical protein
MLVQQDYFFILLLYQVLKELVDWVQKREVLSIFLKLQAFLTGKLVPWAQLVLEIRLTKYFVQTQGTLILLIGNLCKKLAY